MKTEKEKVMYQISYGERIFLHFESLEESLDAWEYAPVPARGWAQLKSPEGEILREGHRVVIPPFNARRILHCINTETGHKPEKVYYSA